MLNTIQIGRALFVVAALLQLGAAQAETTYRSQLSWGYTPSTGSGQDVTTTTGGTYSMSGIGYSMTTSGSPLNNGTAEAQFSADIGAVAVGTNIKYTASLMGPAGVLVPVRVIAYGLAEGEGYDPCCGTEQYSVGAHITVDSKEQGSLISQFASANTGVLSQSFSFDQYVYMLSGTNIEVNLFAGASTISPYTHTSTITGHAFVDPQFIIDPAYASQYSFVGLPTVVPEPASGVLLALGGGVIALASRRRRHSHGQPSGETPIKQRYTDSTQAA